MNQFELRRTPQTIDWICDTLNQTKMSFTLKHGTYTTTIEHALGKTKLFTNNFKTKVFCAAQMIKKEAKESESGKEIMATVHQKKNFDSSQNLKNLYYPTCFNIDLKSAYANCLLNSGLISKKTYSYIMQLAKMDRLAAVGMLATSHIKYHFKDGKCVGFDPYREPTSEIFFYLIDEINYIMQDLKFILGNDFLFYWVDGVFFKPTTSVRKIESVENLLTTLNYPYRYEKVENFSVEVETDKVIIKMTKNDEQKRYEFSTAETGKEIAKNVYKKYKNQYEQQ